MNGTSAALWARYQQALGGIPPTGWALTAGVVVLLVAGLHPWPLRWERARVPARWACVGLLAAVAVAWAWKLRWISDDAFISFRYARNWVEGHGLVFNAGERVEGYTNFLWTALLAVGLLLGIPSGTLSIVLGLASLAVVVVLTARLPKSLGPRRARSVLPIGAVLLTSSYLFVNFGTSGLETMFAAALLLFSVERALRNRPLSSGFIGILAVMSHPDHAIFYAALGFALALDEEVRKDLWRYMAPFGVVYLPYFAARWAYYGAFFPNTYYAKSAGASYISQGQVYLLVCILGLGLLGWIPMLLAGLRTQRSRLLGRFLLIAAPVYLLYVLKIGGDFMAGRLLVPLLPFAAISVELGARQLAASRRFACAAAGLAVAAMSALPLRLILPGEKLFFIADERSFYPVRQLHPLRVDSPYTTWSDHLLSAFHENPEGPLVATGCVGIVAYRTRYPMLDVLGLTDPTVARKPIARRSRPGHEKLASASYLVERGVKMTDQVVFPADYTRFTEVLPGLIPLHLVGYDKPLVDALRKSGQAPADVEAFIADYAPPSDDAARFDCDLWFFESYYFAHQADDARSAFIARLVADGHLEKRSAEVRALPEGAVPSSWTRVGGIDFSSVDRKRWLVTGTAFDVFPSDEPASGQMDIGHHQGPFANSFTSELGDAATGAIQSPPFRLEGEVVTLWVGGGRDLEGIRVSLVAEGEELGSATGCGSEVLGLRVWDVSSHRGQEARLVILDRQPQPWGHILVDEVQQWRVGP